MIETLNQIIEDGFNRKLVHNYTSNEENKNHSSILLSEHEEMINFGSCSYLNLENETSLKEGVIEAVTKFGTQFSSSRTYLSIGLYKELESLLGKIFHKPLIVTASTTLGHLATIPVIVGQNDAVVLDLQVHSSIQMTVQQLKAKKIPVHLIHHNCMESLESKIKALSNKHDKIWYFADGVYSMYGDYAPFDALTDLLDKYEKLNLYIDDAHGMGWTGKNGAGVVRNHMKHHDRMVLAVSLNKSFAAAGGCIVFPNPEMERLVRNCGSTYIFSGPIQPPMLGAAIASAKLHLSDDINERQYRLFELIRFTNKTLDEFGFPQFQKTDSPLFFIPVGLPKICYDIISEMKERGFFLNTASFPAVPMKRSGIRFMINSSLHEDEIHAMIQNLSEVYAKVVYKDEFSYSEIARKFKIDEFEIQTTSNKSINSKANHLNIEIANTIAEVNKNLWDANFEKQGTLNYDNIKLIERVFKDEEPGKEKWAFKYITIYDDSGICLLQTFLTVTTTKDDMFSPDYVSQKVEALRANDFEDYLTTQTLIVGSLATKGNHLFLNRNHELWKDALNGLTHQIGTLADDFDCGKILIRDFYGEPDPEIEKLMLELGFIKYRLPNNMVIHDMNWDSEEEYLSRLTQKYRYNVRKEILRFQDQFFIEYGIDNEELLDQCYRLYLEVHQKSFALNVHQLPKTFFAGMMDHDNYDILRLYLNDNDGTPRLVGVMFSHMDDQVYNAMIVGLDYKYVYEFNTYKQILFQTLSRAKELGKEKLDLAFTAELEKKKIGAKPEDVFAFVQVSEHFNDAILESLR